MKEFYYIDENNKETLDLISLFENAFGYEVDYDKIVIAIGKIMKYVDIKEKKR